MPSGRPLVASAANNFANGFARGKSSAVHSGLSGSAARDSSFLRVRVRRRSAFMFPHTASFPSGLRGEGWWSRSRRYGTEKTPPSQDCGYNQLPPGHPSRAPQSERL